VGAGMVSVLLFPMAALALRRLHVSTSKAVDAKGAAVMYTDSAESLQ